MVKKSISAQLEELKKGIIKEISLNPQEIQNAFLDILLPPTPKDLKTGIRVSFELKNQLDKLEFLGSYEDKIIELIHQYKLIKSENERLKQIIPKEKQIDNKNDLIKLNISEFIRKKEILDLLDLKITYSHNIYVKSPNKETEDEFFYSIQIEESREYGKKISLDKLYYKIFLIYHYIINGNKKISLNQETIIYKGEQILYFLILFNRIKLDFGINQKPFIDNLDNLEYLSYKLSKLNIPKKIMENDVNDKRDSFEIKLKSSIQKKQ